MTKPVVVVSDEAARVRDIASCLGGGFGVIAVDPAKSPDTRADNAVMMIVDVDLSNRDMVDALRRDILNAYHHLPSVFVTDENRRLDIVQSNALGANKTISRRQAVSRLKKIAETYARTSDAADPMMASAAAVERLADLNNELFAAVARAEPLPREEVVECGHIIADTLRKDGISKFLKEVRHHHSYTHRHSMCVTGFAVAFGLHYGMHRNDVQRLAIGGLMHDVGKARVPLAILDKPTALTSEERKLVREHALYSADILMSDGQFSQEVVEIARHHHEYLDGTGYPDGLKDDEIGDLVRIITIVDIFSALIDRRAYKKAIPPATAYQMMQRMPGKIDMQLLSAFEPVALQNG